MPIGHINFTACLIYSAFLRNFSWCMVEGEGTKANIFLEYRKNVGRQGLTEGENKVWAE